MDIEYTKDNPLRCFFAFEGYNSQGLALNRLKHHYPDFDWVCVGRSEIDKYAIQAADALFPEAKDKNFGNISEISWNDVPYFDLLTYSFPCTNLSFAGKQEGCEEGSGTASSLLWECRKAIIAKRPKYLLMENVKALVSQKFLPYFLKWQNELASYGYTNFVKVLNSKNFGCPQNRERIFMVSILDDNASYHFPEPFPLDKRLKDVLEEDVDEKYYLSKKVIDTFIERNKINEDKGNGFKFEPTDGDCVASSGLTMPGSRPCDNYIKEPIACAMRGREVYGIKHVNNLIESGKIPTDKVAFLDGYNQAVHTDVSATIKTNIDKENLMFVSIPQCLTPKRTEYGKKVCKEYESGAFKESRHNMQQLEPRTDGVCNTITSVHKDCLIIEPNIAAVARQVEEMASKARGKDICANVSRDNRIVTFDKATGKSCSDMKIDNENGISQTVISAHEPKVYGESTGYRIRKLTEREVFRLMDVDDADIDKIQAAGISRSQQYKLAGNSIVTNVLFHIFRKLFIDTENENKQLTLF